MSDRPRLLDLFCGAGGAGMGYHRAGFEVVGIDHRPQPHYPFAFVQADALEYCRDHGREFDVIHASPPCQAYSRATAWRGDRSKHPDLIAVTRAALLATGRSFVIENVQESRHLLRHPTLLCGSALGLPFRRHRYFELWGCGLVMVPPCQHRRADYCFDHGAKQPESVYRDALGCDWMTVCEARQAIPPAYTEYLGHAILGAKRE